MALTLIILGGLLSIVYGLWAINDVMKRDAGSQRMQEIAAAIAEGAQAYLRRQYTTIGIVGVVLFVLLAVFLGLKVAIGFLIGAVLYRHERVGPGQRPHRPGRLDLAGRRPRRRLQVGGGDRHAGGRPRPAGRGPLLPVPYPRRPSRSLESRGDRRARGPRLRRLSDLDLRPPRRWHLHQGRGCRRRPRRQGRGRYPGGR